MKLRVNQNFNRSTLGLYSTTNYFYNCYFTMPRGGRSRSPPARSTPAASKPATQPQPRPTHTPAPTQQSGGMFSGLGSTLMIGMAFGAGSQVAHQAVRGLMGGSSHNEVQEAPQQQQYQQQQNSNVCQFEINNFTNCLKENKELAYCQRYSDLLRMCQENNPQ